MITFSTLRQAQSRENLRALHDGADKTLPGVRFIHGTNVIWK
jgi:hypothetical protein